MRKIEEDENDVEISMKNGLIYLILRKNVINDLNDVVVSSLV